MCISYGWVRGSGYNAALEIMYKHVQGVQKGLKATKKQKLKTIVMKGLKHFKPKVEEREGDCCQTIKHSSGKGSFTGLQ